MIKYEVLSKQFLRILILSICLVCICGCEDRQAENKIVVAKADIACMTEAVKIYYQDNSKLPETLNDLVEQPDDAPNWIRCLEFEYIPKDPWGNDYVYEKSSGKDFRIICYGADGKPGGNGTNADFSRNGEIKIQSRRMGS